MAEARSIESLADALRDLRRWFSDTGTRGIIIGGVAASLLGRPRATRDVDALVGLPDESWDAFVAAGTRFGFAPRIADCVAFARRSRVFLMRHAPSNADMDITIGALPFEIDAIGRGTDTQWGDVLVALPTAEDLIVMKAVAGRPRDLADIEGVVAAQPKLDRKAVLATVKTIAEILEQPEILTRVEPLLVKRRKRR